MTDETYNHHGPECPYCGHVHEHDGGYFFDEDGGEEFECESCERLFKWSYHRLDAWSCIPAEPEQEKET